MSSYESGVTRRFVTNRNGRAVIEMRLKVGTHYLEATVKSVEGRTSPATILEVKVQAK